MTSATTTADERTGLLRRRIGERTRDGYRIQSQTETTAQLVKPKGRFSLMWFLIITILSIGTLFWLYPLYHIFLKRDTGIYLEVDEFGKVRETRR